MALQELDGLLIIVSNSLHGNIEGWEIGWLVRHGMVVHSIVYIDG